MDRHVEGHINRLLSSTCHESLSMHLLEAGDIEASVSYFEKFQFDKKVHVLDIGARFGTFLSRIYGHGYHNVTGIDVDVASISRGLDAYPYLRKRLHAYDGASLPYKSETFDVITMFDVIEHIPHIAAFMEEVYRVLKRHGAFLFQTPNIITNVPWEIAQRRSFTSWKTYHCSLQNLYSLRKLLRGAGFSQLVIEKHVMQTEHKVAEIQRVFGFVGPFLLKLSSSVPLAIYPNFWGNAKKLNT